MNMHYDKGMAPSKSGPGKSSNSGQTQSTRGASVKSGLSSQEDFHGESNKSLGMCTSGKLQAPVHPKKKLSTDRGDFTLH